MLNIQVERQENHTAKLTVEVEPQRFEAAKQQAARKLSNRLNVPGFRKGKAPYRVILNYVGEGAIVEEAVDLMGEQLYKDALIESGIDPYGPGSLQDVKFDTVPTFIYILPMQPEVDLAAYRDVRKDYVVPDVEDEALDRSMRQLLEQNAVIEDSARPVEMGNRLTLDIHSYFVETHEDHDHDHDHEGDDADHDHDAHEEGDEPHTHEAHGEHFIYENDFVTLLNDDYEPIPGFNAALVGLNVDDKKGFELAFPDDEKDDELKGRKVKFEVTVKKIESFTMPTLTDDFAARVTAEEEKPLTLLELRMRTRQNLTEANERRYRSEYANAALDEMVQGAVIKYPEDVVQDEVERSLQRFDQQLRQQSRLTLQDYIKITKADMNTLYQQFRPAAVRTVERALVMRELLDREQIEVTTEQLDQELDKIVNSYDEAQREQIRRLFESPEMRESVIDDVLTNALMDRVTAIAKGEAPELAEAAPASVISAGGAPATEPDLQQDTPDAVTAPVETTTAQNAEQATEGE
ncbi:MAG: trigger factor [bacterium]|nr:trigger factor [bacterium]